MNEEARPQEPVSPWFLAEFCCWSTTYTRTWNACTRSSMPTAACKWPHGSSRSTLRDASSHPPAPPDRLSPAQPT